MPEVETDIGALFAKDPLEYGRMDLTAIVERLRSQRIQFVNGNAKAGVPSSKVSKATKDQAEAAKIVGDAVDLGDFL